MLATLQCLATSLLLAPFAAASTGGYALIADAGSTGTRMYLFHLPDGEAQVKIEDLGKGPALSSFQEKPMEAYDCVKKQLLTAKAMIPEEFHAETPVSVFATAGMRLVPQEIQSDIYRGLLEGMFNGEDHVAFGAMEARTISGREEGIFALLAANYLAKHVSSSMHVKTGELMGVLDLGGSSTQVASPPVASAGAYLAHSLGREKTFVKSFLKLGMERMRQRTFASFVETADESLKSQKAVPNPCSFEGYSEEGDIWQGKGEASLCEKAIANLLKQDQSSCDRGEADLKVSDCLGSEPVLKAPKTSDAKFFLISGYLYVTDFARWWLTQPGSAPTSLKAETLEATFQTPTIGEIREAARSLCSATWSKLSAAASDPSTKHRFTPPKKVPHRCFEANYVAALLSTGYGFSDEDRLFKVVEDIDGGEIEWTLGAFLHNRATHSNDTGLEHSKEL